MCRFVYYQGLPLKLSALLTEPENSLINQSYRSKESKEPLNGDGFGVAWYPDNGGVPALFKSVTPAWSNLNLREISRAVRSPRILGHVRAASPGLRVSEINSHPFRFGSLTFMHNGMLGGFHRFRRKLLASLSEENFDRISGGTDTEHMFAVIVDELDRVDKNIPGVLRLAEALERGIERLLVLRDSIVPDEHFTINCLLTDGRDAVACRFTTDNPSTAPSLYVHCGKRYRYSDSNVGLQECRKKHASVLISSEPLTEDISWETVAAGELVMIQEDQALELRRLKL